ncbi:SHC-adaptor protein [Carabus blaptoides fortunei]
MSRANFEQGGGFVRKPARGWLHADILIIKEGVTYTLRYVGCLEVNTSMKSLDFDTRSQVARECINRVCEAAGLKTADRTRLLDRKVAKHIASSPRMEHAGSNVSLTISSNNLKLTSLDSGQVIALHDMPRISFASGGDTDTLDFVAYVAKDLNDWRACYVLECGGGLAQDVISTIGQAFELRFKQYQKKPLQVLSKIPVGMREPDRDYYNDLPGKVPPDVGPPPVPPLPSIVHSFSTLPSVQTSNLIDLNSDPITLEHGRGHDYVNDNVSANTTRDVFDMQPFTEDNSQRSQLERELWFHGSISRAEAENIVRKDGDFLVRESQGTTGQYVLTGMQGTTKKHLLLIDPEGVVRTKDRMFESINHLINYHCENSLPIISAEKDNIPNAWVKERIHVTCMQCGVHIQKTVPPSK